MSFEEKANILIPRYLELFWPSTCIWKILWVEFSGEEVPFIRHTKDDREKVDIILTKESESYEYQQNYQFFHELLHVISIKERKEDTTFLEEWIATYCSMIWFKYIFPENNSYLTAAKEYNNNLNNKYWLAFKAVYKILAQYPNCIKNIRQEKYAKWENSDISLITKKELITQINWEFETQVDTLIQKFYQ